MTDLSQIRKLRDLRKRKAEQANAALLSARSQLNAWETAADQWQDHYEQLRQSGSAVIAEVMDEGANSREPHRQYQRLQSVLRKQRQAESHALFQRERNRNGAVQAADQLEEASRSFAAAQGRERATDSMATKVESQAQKQVEARQEEAALDEYAARLFVAKSGEQT